jgi:hypothetical protein
LHADPLVPIVAPKSKGRKALAKADVEDLAR